MLLFNPVLLIPQLLGTGEFAVILLLCQPLCTPRLAPRRQVDFSRPNFKHPPSSKPLPHTLLSRRLTDILFQRSHLSDPKPFLQIFPLAAVRLLTPKFTNCGSKSKIPGNTNYASLKNNNCFWGVIPACFQYVYAAYSTASLTHCSK